MLYIDGIAPIYQQLRGRRFEDNSGLPLATKRPAFVNIKQLAEGLERRAVSVMTDEPLCLSAHLDLPRGTLTDCPPQDRMREFRKVVPQIPVNVLFSKGATLNEPGFRWAPAFLLSTHEGLPIPTYTGHQDAICLDTRGLVVRLKGAFVNRTRIEVPVSKFFIPSSTVDGQWTHIADYDEKEYDSPFSPVHLDEAKWLRKPLAMLLLKRRTEGTFHHVTLVHILEEVDGIIYASRGSKGYLDTLNGAKTNPGSVRLANKFKERHAKLGPLMNEQAYATLECDWTSDEHLWCID